MDVLPVKVSKVVQVAIRMVISLRIRNVYYAPKRLLTAKSVQIERPALVVYLTLPLKMAFV